MHFVKNYTITLLIALSMYYICPVISNEEIPLNSIKSESERYEDYLETINGNPEALERRKKRVREITRQIEKREAEEKGYINKPYDNENFLFQRVYLCYCKFQDYQSSLKTFDIIQSKKEKNITFNPNTLYPFDKKGTCSAMALDFLARYLIECPQGVSTAACRSKIQSFAPIYASDTAVFKSRQAAYNTITVKKPIFPLTLEEISHHKMQSLANYHNIALTPVTKLISKYKLFDDLHDCFKNLPNGVYLIRGYNISDNHKMETYGHTMGMIKENAFFVFFDNAEGAVESKLSSAAARVIDRYFDYTRVYKVTCKSGSCTNLSGEVTTTHGGSCFKLTYP